MSPYDIPRQVRGGYDEDCRRFFIEFAYIAPEDTERRELDEHVVASVGKSSGRLYRLEIDVDSLEVDEVAIRVFHAVERLVEDHPHQARGDANYLVAKRVLEQRQAQLFAR